MSKKMRKKIRDKTTITTRLYADGEVICETVEEIDERVEKALNYIKLLDTSKELHKIEKILKGE